MRRPPRGEQEALAGDADIGVDEDQDGADAVVAHAARIARRPVERHFDDDCPEIGNAHACLSLWITEIVIGCVTKVCELRDEPALEQGRTTQRRGCKRCRLVGADGERAAVGRKTEEIIQLEKTYAQASYADRGCGPVRVLGRSRLCPDHGSGRHDPGQPDGRRRADVCQQDHRRQRGQLEGSHHARRRREGRRPRRDAAGPGPVHRVRADQCAPSRSCRRARSRCW